VQAKRPDSVALMVSCSMPIPFTEWLLQFLQKTCRTDMPWSVLEEGRVRLVYRNRRDLSQQYALQGPVRPVGATGLLQELFCHSCRHPQVPLVRH